MLSLLYALEFGQSTSSVTQDQSISTRARRVFRPSLVNRVLTGTESGSVAPSDDSNHAEVRLPLVEELPAHAIRLDDEIFDSLRDGYRGFGEW